MRRFLEVCHYTTVTKLKYIWNKYITNKKLKITIIIENKTKFHSGSYTLLVGTRKSLSFESFYE